MTDAEQYPLFGQTLVALITAKTGKRGLVIGDSLPGLALVWPRWAA